jgi:hypothetical protein
MNLAPPTSWTDAAQIAQAIIQFIGIPFVIYQVSELQKSLYSSTHSNIYTRYADTMRCLLDRPHLYPYFRENGRLEDSGATLELPRKRAEVQSLCELTTTLFEHATLERNNMPSTSWQDCWLPYIKASYEQSFEMRLFFETHQDFYISEYCRLIESEVAPKIKPVWVLKSKKSG